MNWKPRIADALASPHGGPDDDVLEELAQHAQATYEAARADGCTPDEAQARVAAVIDRWRIERPLLRRSSRRPGHVEPPSIGRSRVGGVLQDLRYAARLLRRQPRATLLVVLTMALGIGGATILFSLTWRVLLKPLPWPNADALVTLRETRGGTPPRFGEFTNAAYLAWLEDAKTIDGLAAWTSGGSVTFEAGGPPERIRTARSTASLFALLGVPPLAGSFYTDADARAAVVVISETLWRRHFAGDAAAIGTAVRLDGRPHTIVGVIADDVAFPHPQIRAWRPFPVTPAKGNFLSLFSAMARLKPGATVEQAAAEGTARGRFALDTSMTTTAIFGNNGPIQITAQSLRDTLAADVKQPLIILMTGVGLLLATATANIASLQLARATSRRRELAIRAALGAGRARVTRQLLIENLLLGVMGGAAGLSVAWMLHGSLPAVLPADFPQRDTLAFDSVVILFAVVVTVVTALLVGLAPALGVRRVDLVSSLGDDSANAIGAGVRTARGRAAIMVAQVAIACVLLIGASLLGRSFLALAEFDRGFDPDHALTAMVSVPRALYTEARRFAIVDQLLERLSRHPAVAHAGFTSELPLTRGGSTSAFRMQSPVTGSTVEAQASPRVVSPRYFAAIGMRVVEGRGFADSDTDSAPAVVVVNRAFARQFLGDAPLGVQLPIVGYDTKEGERQLSTVIGVVDDIRYMSPDVVSQPEIYYTYRQLRGSLDVPVVHLIVRTTGDPSDLAPSIHTAVREVDHGLVPDSVATLDDRVRTMLARPRLSAVLLGTFAAGALAIAAVGLFGVVSYIVAQRARELAVRTALGARRSQVVLLVLRQGLMLTLAGIGAGLAASVLLMRTISTQLFGVSPFDPVAYTIAPVLLFLISVIACAVPARAAATLDPVRILRNS